MMGKKNTPPKIAIQTDVLIDAYQLTKAFGSPFLENWLQAKGELNEMQSQLLTTIYSKSLDRMGGWNEEELKMKLISILFFIADFEEDGKITTFYERTLNEIVGEHTIHVVCDCLIASPLGLTTPKNPYFFLQEFKKQKGDSNDPEGQMLAAMLAAQHLNNDGKPIYGSWLTGSIWIFTILEGKNYYFSNAFDATNKADLLQIVFILRKLKDLILSR
jgi:hypothetical protein